MKREQLPVKLGEGKIVTFADYISPKIEDVQGQKWVLWGQNNDFYDYLRDCYLNSTTNNAVINGLVKLAFGDGLKFDDAQRSIKLENVLSQAELRRVLLQFYITNKFAAQVEYYMKDDKRDIEKGVRKIFFTPAKEIGIGKKDDDGEITCYYVSKNWAEKQNKKYRPKQVPAFGCGGEEDEIEIYLWQLEIDNDEYFCPVMYQGCLQYCESEIEVSNYHLNHILNGFAIGGIINFNNGAGTPETRRQITRDLVRSKAGSGNAGKQFITFNESSENAVTVSSYDIPDPHKQYEFIDTKCEKKILLAHNVTSPLLFGIRDTSGGLGSNANEIREAYEIMREMTLEPIRQAFLQGLEPLLLECGIAQLPKFSDLEIFTKPVEQPEQAAAPAQMSDQKCNHFSGEEVDIDLYESKWLTALESIGEIPDGEEWAEASVTEVTDPEAEDQLLSVMMANTSPADGQPQDASPDGDAGLFKIRYRYGPIRNSTDSRALCKYLEQKAAQGVVYRKEDIESWEQQGVNGQFAPEGQTKYSLWLWKGGAYCHHRWFRVIYFRKRNASGQFLPKSTDADMSNDKKVSLPQARTAGVPEDKINSPGWSDAATAPIDQPNRGSLKNR